MAQWVNKVLLMAASDINAVLCPGFSTSDPATC